MSEEHKAKLLKEAGSNDGSALIAILREFGVLQHIQFSDSKISIPSNCITDFIAFQEKLSRASQPNRDYKINVVDRRIYISLTCSPLFSADVSQQDKIKAQITKEVGTKDAQALIAAFQELGVLKYLQFNDGLIKIPSKYMKDVNVITFQQDLINQSTTGRTYDISVTNGLICLDTTTIKKYQPL